MSGVRVNFTEFSARVADVALQMPGVASALAKRATVLLAHEIVQGAYYGPGTPVDTGAARNSWTAFPSDEGSTAKPFTPRRSPDQTGAAAMALIIQAVEMSAPDVVRFTLATACPYMNVLEYGNHSRQAPDGMIRVALAAWQRIVDMAARDVRRRVIREINFDTGLSLDDGAPGGGDDAGG